MYFNHTIKNGKTHGKESEWLPVWVGPRRTCPLSCKPAPTGRHRHLAVWTQKCVVTQTLILSTESNMYDTMKKIEGETETKKLKGWSKILMFLYYKISVEHLWPALHMLKILVFQLSIFFRAGMKEKIIPLLPLPLVPNSMKSVLFLQIFKCTVWQITSIAVCNKRVYSVCDLIYSLDTDLPETDILCTSAARICIPEQTWAKGMLPAETQYG